MQARLAGKVALITGAARGQGRSHAVRLAQEGADIIAVDICQPLSSVAGHYPGATEHDLAETVTMVEREGRRITALKADVRDYTELKGAVDHGVEDLGRLDIVVANAGIFSFGPQAHEVEEGSWHELIDTNLTGVWHTVKAATPYLQASGPGASVMIINSLAGFRGLAHSAAYATSKHGLLGLLKVLTNELGTHGIRVNSIHPNAIDTVMIKNESVYRLFCPELDQPSEEDAAPRFASLNPMGVPYIDAVHVSNLIVFLASDEARYISGAQIPVDAGASVRSA